MKKALIGFIGQGYIGKNYADDFEKRGFPVVRYALEEPHLSNKDKIKDCDIVFVAVPTPTTPDGFDDSIIRSAITYAKKGSIVVIKSTVLPDTTKKLQKSYPDVTLLVSPEFLSEATAAYDAAHPFSNIVGMPTNSQEHKTAAKRVHALLPESPFVLTCDSTEAEIIKYTHNASGYAQIILFNLIYDIAKELGGNWEIIEKALRADPLISNRYASPIHKSGRGAGGHCFIKDLAALRELYVRVVGDKEGLSVLQALEGKNKQLLRKSKKDLDLLQDVYGVE